LIQGGHSLTGPKVPDIKWIPLIGLSRHCAVSALEWRVEPFLEKSAYRSLDLYGDEFAQPIESFSSDLLERQSKGLRLKDHPSASSMIPVLA
jgi:hypothetical protein